MKVILITSKDCPPCKELKALLEEAGLLGEYEILDVESEEDVDKIGDIFARSPEVLKDETPQCITKKDDGTYSACDINEVWDKAEGKKKKDD